MKQKDYEEIAKMLASAKKTEDRMGIAIPYLCEQLADYFEKTQRFVRVSLGSEGYEDVDTFNRKQFLKQCGVE